MHVLIGRNYIFAFSLLITSLLSLCCLVSAVLCVCAVLCCLAVLLCVCVFSSDMEMDHVISFLTSFDPKVKSSAIHQVILTKLIERMIDKIKNEWKEEK
jgi:hypothetical protein